MKRYFIIERLTKGADVKEFFIRKGGYVGYVNQLGLWKDDGYKSRAIAQRYCKPNSTDVKNGWTFTFEIVEKEFKEV